MFCNYGGCFASCLSVWSLANRGDEGLEDRTQELLGKVLSNARIAQEAVLALQTKWIAGDRERLIHIAMVGLLREGREITANSVEARCKTLLNDEKSVLLFGPSGPSKWLTSLETSGAKSSTRDWPDAVRDIETAYRRRVVEGRLLSIKQQIQQATHPDEVMQIAAEEIAAAVCDSAEPQAVDSKTGFQRWLERRTGDYKPLKEWSWPFPTWNNKGRLREGQIVAFGAPSGAGKSWMGLQMLDLCCKRNGRVAYFSMEMTEPELRDRLVMMGGRITAADIDPLTFNRAKVEERLAALDGYRFTVYEGTTSVRRIKSAIIRARTVGNPYDMIVIDHLRLLDVGGQNGYRIGLQEAMTEIRALTNTEGIATIMLGQLRRPNQDVRDYRPRMTDFAESGAIEQIADYCLLMKRDEDDEYGNENPNGRIWCDKRRGGRRYPIINIQLNEEWSQLVELSADFVGAG